jgi:DNA invertase Pin-like site-specific DNA recombinase
MLPAAQYLRMSTEHQQYSLENQSDIIRAYAVAGGYEVVKTYSDAAKSGVTLRKRKGLQQLLEEVVGGTAQFQVVLVYDVSRWGRFQDADEAAHYEFLCKSAGIPVEYCAESFTNQTGLTNAVMKALKRAMAGEYSRELSVKVKQGHERLARMGFRQGGPPGYGLRRMLLASDSRPSRILEHGEGKGLTDRVILVPGPEEEVSVVREIFQLFTKERKSLKEIPRILNGRGTPFLNGVEWDHQDVRRILTGCKYTGCLVYGRKTESFGAKATLTPRAKWVINSTAFEPIVSQSMFDEAQRIIASWTINKTDGEILDGIRGLLRTKGRLSAGIIQTSRDVPCLTTLNRRFGGLLNIYTLLAYKRSTRYFDPELVRITQAARDLFIDAIAARFPDDAIVLPPLKKGRRRGLRVQSLAANISIVVCRHTLTPVSGESRWIFFRHRQERKLATVMIRMAEDNKGTKDVHILSPVQRGRVVLLPENHHLIAAGSKLNRLGDFVRLVKKALVF